MRSMKGSSISASVRRKLEEMNIQTDFAPHVNPMMETIAKELQKSPKVLVNDNVIKSTTGYECSLNIYVGPSKVRSKEVQLPYENMMVFPQPQNPLGHRWNDATFEVVMISGKKFRVTRSDADKGWKMDLELKAYYKEESVKTHEKVLNANIRAEGSAVTVMLMPNQKIRCVPSALIFKAEDVVKIADNVGCVARSTVPGMLKGKIKDFNQGIRRSLSNEENEDENAIAEYKYAGKDLTIAILTFGGQFPEKVLHLSLGKLGNRLIFRQGSFLASSADVDVVDSKFLDKFQSLVGHGDVFLKTGPLMRKVDLKENDTLAVKETCLIAFTQDVTSHSEMSDRFKGVIFEKRVVVRTLKGPGTVWLNNTRGNILEKRSSFKALGGDSNAKRARIDKGEKPTSASQSESSLSGAGRSPKVNASDGLVENRERIGQQLNNDSNDQDKSFELVDESFEEDTSAEKTSDDSLNANQEGISQEENHNLDVDQEVESSSVPRDETDVTNSDNEGAARLKPNGPTAQ